MVFHNVYFSFNKKNKNFTNLPQGDGAVKNLFILMRGESRFEGSEGVLDPPK